MRLYKLAVLCASASFIAAPAFAQNASQANASNMPNHADATHSGMGTVDLLKQDLEKAGFTNINILPEAFIVHATNSEGDRVVMRITPDVVEAVAVNPNIRGGPNGNGSSSDRSSAGQPRTKTE